MIKSLRSEHHGYEADLKAAQRLLAEAREKTGKAERLACTLEREARECATAAGGQVSSLGGLQAAQEAERTRLEALVDERGREVNQLREDLNAAHHELTGSQEQLAAMTAALTSSDAGLAHARSCVKAGQEARLGLQKELEAVRRDLEWTELRLKTQEEKTHQALGSQREERLEKESYSAELAQCGSELDLTRDRLRKAERMLQEAREECARAREDAEREETSCAELERARAALKAENDRLHAALRRAEQGERDLQDELTGIQTQLAAARKDVKVSKTECERVEAERVEVAGRLAQVEAALEEETQAAQEARKARDQLQVELEHLQHDYDTSLRFLEQHKSLLTAVTSERDSLAAAHSKCYVRQVCSVGVELCQKDSATVAVADITPGVSLHGCVGA